MPLASSVKIRTAPSASGKIQFTPTTVGSSGETYETFYKVFGDPRNPPKGRRAIVAVHGGPGMNHLYMLPNQALYHEAGIPVILYDQIGGGASTHLPNAPAKFWTPELFMEELTNVLKFFGIENDYDLLGQSWGGMLVAQYAATLRPAGLKRLIISNSPASIELNTLGTDTLLLRNFSEEYRSRIKELEEKGETSSEEYETLAMQFYLKHVCTVDPWPAELMESFAEMKKDSTVYETMLGPSEFTTIGSLKNWNIIPIIHNISVPTLLISSPNDSVQEVSALPFFHKVPKIKWVQLQNSTHLGQFEEPERYYEVLLEFLNQTEPDVVAAV